MTLIITFFFFFCFLRILSILTHMRREEKVLKKLTVVCIQKDLTLGYTTPTLNLFNSYSFFNVKFTQFFFFKY